MSDLISREKVIDVLKETGIIQDNDLGHLVVDEINRIPTAYDVEAVVEKMEEIADKAVGGCHTLEPCHHMADDTKCMDCITERFTEVVRSGGKE